MDHRHRRVGRPWPGVVVQTAGDEPEKGTSVRGREQCHVARSDVLIGRRDHLVRLGQVHPQLDPVEQSTGRHQLRRWGFDVEDPRLPRSSTGCRRW